MNANMAVPIRSDVDFEEEFRDRAAWPTSADVEEASRAGSPSPTHAMRARAERNRQRARALRLERAAHDSAGGFLVEAVAEASARAARPVRAEAAPRVDPAARPPCLQCARPIALSYLLDTFQHPVCDDCRLRPVQTKRDRRRAGKMTAMQAMKKTSAWRLLAARACSGGRAPESPLRRLLDEAGAFGEPARRAAGELGWATQPYAARPAAAAAEALDPREATVLLFPGQGSQRVGMGLRLAAVRAARDLYERASSVVGWDVWRVCTEGPADELERRCQTCVLVTSLAALERAREERPAALERVRAVAGFSLGELAAVTYAGALPLDGALRLVELRQAAMLAEAAARPQGMLTVWLAPDARLEDALRAARDAAGPHAECRVANYLYPGCRVLAGDEAALALLERRGGEWGVRRSARVRSTGACHTPLMARAGEALGAALAALEVAAPRVRVVSCVDGRAYSSAGSVRRGLARGVTAPVRWQRALGALYARPRGTRFPLTLALGPGGALRASLRQVNARAWDSSLQVEV